MNKKSTNKTNMKKTNKTNAKKTNKRSASSKTQKSSDWMKLEIASELGCFQGPNCSKINRVKNITSKLMKTAMARNNIK